MSDDMTGAGDEATIRPTRTVVVWVVLIAVLGGLITWRVVYDERRAASVGQVVAAADSLVDARSSYVMTPTGRLDIRATAAVDDVDGDTLVRKLQAPDDGSFVGLQLALRKPISGVDPLALTGASIAQQELAPTLTLVADGRRYPLRSDENRTDVADLRLPGRWYVAVAGEPSKLELEVSVQSYTQRVDLRSGKRVAGIFAPLYGTEALNRKGAHACGTATLTSSWRTEGGSSSCRVGALLRTPFVVGVGWAAAGKTWLVVSAQVDLAPGFLHRTAGGAEQRFDLARTTDVTLTLTGSPGRGVEVPRTFRTRVQTVAFPVPIDATDLGSVVVSASSPLYPNSGNGGRRTYLPDPVTRWQVAL